MKKNRILIIIIIAIMLFKSTYIKALTISSDTNGYSNGVSFDACGDDPEGCFSYSDNFVIRATLVDADKNIAIGLNGQPTRTVQFTPKNPFNGRDYSTKTRTIYQNYSSAVSAIDTSVNDFVFSGSTIAGTDGQETDEYEIYLGFGKRNAAQDNFDSYADNRDAFIRYATNIRNEDILVQQGEKTLKLSFLEFFLNVCGFTDKWEAFSDEATRNRIAENDYQVIIEPVYSYSQYYDGSWHSVYGTTKQLADLAHNSVQESRFFVPFQTGLAYNYFCNFLEESNYLNLIKDQNYLCNNIETFNFESTNTYSWTETESNSGYQTCVDNCNANRKKNCEGRTVPPSSCKVNCNETCARIVSPYKSTTHFSTTTEFNAEYAKSIYDILRDPNYAPGVNIINLKDSIQKSGPEIININNKCTLEVKSCNNNSFLYSIKLKSDDTFDCVYPSKIFKENEVKNQFYHFENSDLWCYDNLTYKFSNIIGYYSQHKIYNIGQYTPLPEGTLTVDRTCFSKKDLNGAVGTDLDNIFNSDSINNNYQNNFYFTLNDNQYTYIRGTKYQTNTQKSNNDSGKQYKKTSEKSQYGEDYYKYTASFNYSYYATDGVFANKASININDYNVTESLGNTNAIDIDIAGIGNNAKLVNISANTKPGLQINELSTKTKTNGFSVELEKGYGFSQNVYVNLSKNKQKSENSDNIHYGYGKTFTSENTEVLKIYKGTTTYELDETNGKYCEFTTEISSNDIMNDGLQFRVISLTNPFPARDGTSRLAGKNWLNSTENNVKDYIQNNRGVLTEAVYEKEPMYKITLDAPTMIKIREYNKNNSYTDMNLTCEEGTGRMCISSFLRSELSNLEGTCATEQASNIAQITKINERIDALSNLCRNPAQCLNSNKDEIKELDKNGDGIITTDDRLTIEYYTCADKTAASGG